MKKVFSTLIILTWLSILSQNLFSKPKSYGTSLSTTHLLHEEKDLEYSQLGLWMIYDNDPILGTEAPNFLSWIFELQAGFYHTSKTHWVSNFNFITRYSPRKHFLLQPKIEPFLEAGIGFGYRSLKPIDQSYHLNFNPTLGIGLQFNQFKNPIDLRLRLTHFSNAEIGDQNNGTDGIQVGLGYQF